MDVFQVFVWICALGAALAVPMSLRKSRVACLAWLSLYLLSYWYLSLHGRYVGSLQANRWMPLYCEKTIQKGAQKSTKLNALGAFFSPLVWVDRTAVHPNKEPRMLGS